MKMYALRFFSSEEYLHSVVLELSCTLESPGELLKIQISRLHPRPIYSNLWKWGPSSNILKLPGDSNVQSRLRPTVPVNRNLQSEL